MEQFDELNLKRLAEIILKHIRLIIVVTLISGILSFVYSETMIVPEYQSSVSIYVNNRKLENKSQVLTSDIAASQMLVNTYGVIIKSNTVLNQVAVNLEKEGLYGYSASSLKGKISTSSINNTEVLKVTVRDKDKKNTFIIANTIADVFPQIIKDYVEASSVKVVDYAVEGAKVSPNIRNNMIVGLIMGLFLACAIVLLKEIFDMRIKNEDELEKWFKLPILGIVPDISDANLTNKTAYYSYRRTSKAYQYKRKGANDNDRK